MAELSPFRLDSANQCLWRRTGSGGEERILLTPTEFAVLDHLVEHAGQLVTHRELLDAVWPGTAIEPQVVKNKIFHLRRVLEDEPKRPRYIETLPRRGYRFVGRLERSTLGEMEAPVQPELGWSAARLAGGALAGHAQGVAGKGQVVFLTGEPGIGKTALADEFQRQVSAPTTPCGLPRGNAWKASGARKRSTPCSRRSAGCVAGRTAPAWWIRSPRRPRPGWYSSPRCSRGSTGRPCGRRFWAPRGSGCCARSARRWRRSRWGVRCCWFWRTSTGGTLRLST